MTIIIPIFWVEVNDIKTLQDLETAKASGGLENFIENAIFEHKGSEMYRQASEAEEYACRRNVTINKYRKLLYTIKGNVVPDNYSAQHKCASGFFRTIVTQENQYLLGNGVIFSDNSTKEKLGDVDNTIQKLGRYALIDGVSFGFFDQYKVYAFRLTEFVPIWDDYSGKLAAGIRFCQIEDDKPLSATLYERDGITEYVRERGKALERVKDKRNYKRSLYSSKIETTIVDEGNYGRFPIVPLWGNAAHQSELVGIKESIDCYDLIRSGFANDLDDASMIYWTLENCGGMDDVDLVRFKERMRTIGVANTDGGDDGSKATSHTIEVPYQSRETYLKMLREGIYEDACALDVKSIASADVTATQIKAAYELLNNKTDEFEYCVIEFLTDILALAGIDDYPTFKRSSIANMQEETQSIMLAASVLDKETIIRHLPFVQPDEIEDILKRIDGEENILVGESEAEINE